MEFYMRGEQHEKENRKNDLIDRGAVHPEPCGMCLWKDGGSIRYPGTTGGSRRAQTIKQISRSRRYQLKK